MSYSLESLKAAGDRIGAPATGFGRGTFEPRFDEPVLNSCQVDRKELREGVPVVSFKTMRSTAVNPVGTESKTNLSSKCFADMTGISKPPIINKAYGLNNISDVSYGHSNLAWYVYTCWAKEMCTVLRPDMFWFTIVNEIAREVRLFPERYRSLFTDSKEKKTLEVPASSATELPMDILDSLLSDSVPDKVLKDCIVDVPFVTKPSEGFKQVIMSAFAHMAAPFYDYTTCRCGIPEVAVEGRSEDWVAMIQSCSVLRKRFPEESRLNNYVERVGKLLQEIHDNTFCDLSNSESRVASESFFSSIFWATSNCGSGSPYYCKGWIIGLYNRSVSSERYADESSWASKGNNFLSKIRNSSIENILEFPPHVSCVEWQHTDTERMFTQISGLFYSKAEGRFLIPYYGTATYELSKKEFESMKHPKKTAI